MEFTYICDSTRAFWRMVSAALQKSGLCVVGSGEEEKSWWKRLSIGAGRNVVVVDWSGWGRISRCGKGMAGWLTGCGYFGSIAKSRVGLGSSYTQKFYLWFVAWIVVVFHFLCLRLLVGFISHKSPETRLYIPAWGLMWHSLNRP